MLIMPSIPRMLHVFSVDLWMNCIDVKSNRHLWKNLYDDLYDNSVVCVEDLTQNCRNKGQKWKCTHYLLHHL